MKKVFIIVIAILLAGILILAGVYLRMRDRGETPGTGGDGGSGNGSLPVGGGSSASSTGARSGDGLPLTSNSVAEARSLEFFAGPEGDVLYVREDGQIVRATNSSSTLISTTKIPDILDAKFSFDGKMLLVKAGAALSPRWSAYDLEKNSWRQITVDALDMEWAPKDKRVAYVARKTSKSEVATLDLGIASSRPRTHVSLNAEDLLVEWGGGSRLFITERPSALLSGNLWTYDLAKSSLLLSAESVPAMHLTWGSKDQGILFKGRSNGRGGSLHLMEGAGQEIRTFSFLTLPEKCAFYPSSATSTSENIVCAIPRDPRAMSAAQLPDDYHKGALRTADDFYLVSSSDASMKRMVSDLSADAVRLQVSGKDLYFLNRLDSKIYKLPVGG